MASITEQLTSLILSANDLKDLTGWPDSMIEEWLNILRNIVVIASETDLNVDQVVINTADIADLQVDKADKVNPAVLNNIVTQEANGNILDSGVAISVISDNTTAIGNNDSDITDLQNDKANIIATPTTNAIVTQTAGGDIQDSTVLISDLDTLVGTGNPNGVTTSNRSLMYVDDTAAGETLYFNTVVGVNTGWLPL